MRSEQHHLPATYFPLLVPPLIVMVGGEVLGDALASDLRLNPSLLFDLSSRADTGSLAYQQQIFLDAAGRFSFLAALLVAIIVSSGIVAFFIQTTLRGLEPSSRTRVVYAFLFCVALVVAFSKFGHHTGWLRDTGALVGSVVFQNGLMISEQMGGPPGWAHTAINIIQNLTIPVVTAAACVIFGIIGALAGDPDSSNADEVAKQRRDAETYLYLGAVLLVTGIVFEQAWTRWLGFSLPGSKDAPSIREAYLALAASWNLYKGANYSALLASVYIPVAAIISERADMIVAKQKASDPNFDEEKFRAGRQLNVTSLTSLRSGIAILAPFLTGTLDTLPKLLS